MAAENGSESSGVLKADVLGRVKVPVEKREELLDVFEASGMSGKAFAEQHGINVQTFATWIQKRRKRLIHPLLTRTVTMGRSIAFYD